MKTVVFAVFLTFVLVACAETNVVGEAKNVPSCVAAGGDVCLHTGVIEDAVLVPAGNTWCGDLITYTGVVCARCDEGFRANQSIGTRGPGKCVSQ